MGMEEMMIPCNPQCLFHDDRSSWKRNLNYL